MSTPAVIATLVVVAFVVIVVARRLDRYEEQLMRKWRSRTRTFQK